MSCDVFPLCSPEPGRAEDYCLERTEIITMDSHIGGPPISIHGPIKQGRITASILPEKSQKSFFYIATIIVNYKGLPEVLRNRIRDSNFVPIPDHGSKNLNKREV